MSTNTTSKLDAITQAILGGSTGPSTSQLLQAVQAQQPTGVQLADRLSQLGAGAAIYGDQRNAAMQGFVNSMTGKGRSMGDAVNQALSKVDMNTETGQKTALELLALHDPARAVQLKRAIETKQVENNLKTASQSAILNQIDAAIISSNSPALSAELESLKGQVIAGDSIENIQVRIKSVWDRHQSQAPSKDRYERVSVPVTDENGNPVMDMNGVVQTEEILVNVDQLHREQTNSANGVQKYTRVYGRPLPQIEGADTGVTQDVTVNSQQAEQISSEIMARTLLRPPMPPPRSGMTPLQVEEKRVSMTEGFVELDNLIEDIHNPDLDKVVGLGGGGYVQGAVAGALETPGLEELNRRVSTGVIARAIPLAKSLGVNPTDFDFRQIMNSAPKTTDGAGVWRDWFDQKYVPVLTTKLRALYGDAYADVVGALIQQKVEEYTSSYKEAPITVNWNDL